MNASTGARPTTDWSLPYASHRSAVMGRNVVSTSQPLAAQAGLRMLQAGGNAVDAALAAAMVLTVVEPTGCGIGSDAFAIVWDGQELHGLNASGRAPAAWTPGYFAERGGIPEMGWNAVTVPGAVSGWVALSQRFGRLPFAQLAQPAIDYARSGFAVSPTIARQWALGAAKLGGQPGFAECFMPGGRTPRAGEIFRSEAHARTLERIAATEGEDFYRGELARQMAAHARANGGAMTEEDLAAHQADWVGTVSRRFGDSVIHEIPPNGQGIAALMALGMLDAHDIGAQPVDHVDTVHASIEAMKLALADLYRHNADADAMRVAARDLLSDAYVRERAALIDPTRAGDPGHGTPRPGGTVYLAAADESGMMVSFIQSNYMGFGSGVVVPGTGISLQNRGHCFTPEAGHANEVAPRKRPSHTIIPAFAMDADGAPRMAFGVMGGPMQSQGHVQMALRVLRYGQNPQAAADAPRWRVTGGRGVAVEPAFDPAVVEALRARGHEVTVEAGDGVFAFGGAQLVLRLDSGAYAAGSDPRKDGHAVAY
ncbi:gamma-glutamyltransferase family protein [Paracidovorax avenae]|nr:gamma-glutamyltransferase family protein [Paracidovorax avenae]AVS76864.1 gamma-glutamyltransferase [Paracidovorax avenae]AVS83816.1 gamma-glutamyltransferase [Paracidovorax avenae]AVS87235.1 gamma-glutamyltransferase [Paracidovorax avenae]AVT01422.1 gamma-glutamyltransferase [Paracidovorax avenae]AVT08500.1 gamma-glutamyltransferase [Paracidovorax avenae]